MKRTVWFTYNIIMRYVLHIYRIDFSTWCKMYKNHRKWLKFYIYLP